MASGPYKLVTSACHPALDALAVKIASPLIPIGRLAVFLACLGNNPLAFANFVGDRLVGRFVIGIVQTQELLPVVANVLSMQGRQGTECMRNGK